MINIKKNYTQKIRRMNGKKYMNIYKVGDIVEGNRILTEGKQ